MLTPDEQRIFNSYRNIVQVVGNPNNKQYQRHHAAGLEIECEFASFREFYKFVMIKLGPSPSPHARIIRKDQTQNFSPKNLMWGDYPEQARRARGCVKMKFRGKTMCIKDWAEYTGLNMATLYQRYHKGLTPKQVLAGYA